MGAIGMRKVYTYDDTDDTKRLYYGANRPPSGNM